MTLRDEIEATFGVHAFSRPTFYSNPGGLRFELSQGGSAVEQFLTALRKASAICRDVFEVDQCVTICLSVYLWRKAYGYRDALRELRSAGIHVPRTRCIWTTTGAGQGDDPEPTRVLSVAFSTELAMLEGILWCALGADLGIRPNPRLNSIYLMSLPNRVLVHPYDDRGMDVVGSNHALLARLYAKYGSNLLEYDREIMAATFQA